MRVTASYMPQSAEWMASTLPDWVGKPLKLIIYYMTSVSSHTMQLRQQPLMQPIQSFLPVWGAARKVVYVESGENFGLHGNKLWPGLVTQTYLGSLFISQG